MKSAQKINHFLTKTQKNKENRYEIAFPLSKYYFEDLSRSSFSFPVDLEWSRTAKLAIFNDVNGFW